MASLADYRADRAERSKSEDVLPIQAPRRCACLNHSVLP